jgi:hypothetical protein
MLPKVEWNTEAKGQRPRSNIGKQMTPRGTIVADASNALASIVL